MNCGNRRIALYKGPRLKVKFDLTILFSEFALIVFHFWGFFADFTMMSIECDDFTKLVLWLNVVDFWYHF